MKLVTNDPNELTLICVEKKQYNIKGLLKNHISNALVASEKLKQYSDLMREVQSLKLSRRSPLYHPFQDTMLDHISVRVL